MVTSFLAGNILLLLLGLLLLFHCLVITGILPADIVWAGKIKNRKELLQMEIISLIILGLAIFIVSLRLHYLHFSQSTTVANIGVWGLFAFFVLNTLGNLTAVNPIEKYGFGALTLVMSLLTLQLALG